MSPSTSIVREWPTEKQVFLTLDFECDFGTALPENRYEAAQRIDTLVSILEAFEVPLTCFVQTELLKTHPEMVERLRKAGVTVSFHPHSHTHSPRGETSIPAEVEQSTAAYREFFGKDPVGYRFPNGNVRESDYEILAEYGYEFDASVFPSWRPGHFNNTGEPTKPTYRPNHDLFELPFTIYSNRVPIPTALSYCQVIGWPYVSALSQFPPPTIVFNIHMHDLVIPSSVTELPLRYRLLYSRNSAGDGLLREILDKLAGRDYSFATLDEAHNQLRSG